jgi:predicted DNA-binding WGR domain protein
MLLLAHECPNETFWEIVYNKVIFILIYAFANDWGKVTHKGHVYSMYFHVWIKKEYRVAIRENCLHKSYGNVNSYESLTITCMLC